LKPELSFMNVGAERPFFLVGNPRSGTTLLRFMLNSSPRVYIPPESDFIPRFFLRDPHEILTERRIGRILRIIYSRYRFVREWQGQRLRPGDFTRRAPACMPADFLEILYGRYARQNGAVRWGDKTPIYANYIDLIHEIFPEARFVHIVRDGRDAALSMLEAWSHREVHVDLYFAARSWLRRVGQARASGARLGPTLFFELRYEKLVQEPERTLRRLCAFLQEPFVADMVRPHLLARQTVAAGSFHDALRQAPTAARVGRWRREMAPADLRVFQHLAGDLLTNLGYELADAGVMPLTERSRLAALRVKYETLQASRRMAQALGLLPPI
jgi:hypothetical protein